ncbi:MAG TPA: HK97 gp10 family phage protein [Candidatus Binataceae bacterium]|nr:HK97 gp10 family phage protein [Candidatus Binataceae bacterium]
MSAIAVEIVTGRELGQRFAQAGNQVRSLMAEAVHWAQLEAISAIRRNLKATHKMRSGDLARSIAAEEIVESGTEISGRVGSNLEYAEIQERGGTIHAKNVKNLTIPLDAMLTGRGIARGTARNVIDDPGSFGYERTFFRNGILFGSSDGEVTPLFLLKPSVTLPARPYAAPAAEEIRPQMIDKVQRSLAALMGAQS